MSLVAWRKFVRQRGGVLMTLLVLLLAFGGRTCPMMAHADDSAPLPETHGCCHEQSCDTGRTRRFRLRATTLR